MRTQAFGAGFEGLEERLMLAGNVLSALAAGVLVLDGDGVANQVQVTVASNGQLTATGLSGTTIDGLATVNFGVVNTLTVNGGAGDDKITLDATAATITNDVTINGGAGNDTASITGRFGSRLILDGGAGLDALSVSKATVAIDLDLDSGDGIDRVTLSGSTVGRDVLTQTGIGNDSVTINGMSVIGDISVEDTGGHNSFRITNSSTRGDVLIGGAGTLGTGNDTVVVSGVTAGFKAGVTGTGSISINLGDGNNILSMSKSKTLGTVLGDGINVTAGIGSDLHNFVDCQSAGGFSLSDAGPGGNRVELTRVVCNGIGPMAIQTGSGPDSVKLDQVFIRGTGTIDTGLENDILQITNSRFTGRLIATAGDGDDAAFVSSNFFGTSGSSISGGVGTDTVTNGGNQPTNSVGIAFEFTRTKSALRATR